MSRSNKTYIFDDKRLCPVCDTMHDNTIENFTGRLILDPRSRKNCHECNAIMIAKRVKKQKTHNGEDGSVIGLWDDAELAVLDHIVVNQKYLTMRMV